MKFTVTTTKTIHYEDTVEAGSVEEAMKIVDEWIIDDFTEVASDLEITYWEA